MISAFYTRYNHSTSRSGGRGTPRVHDLRRNERPGPPEIIYFLRIKRRERARRVSSCGKKRARRASAFTHRAVLASREFYRACIAARRRRQAGRKYLQRASANRPRRRPPPRSSADQAAPPPFAGQWPRCGAEGAGKIGAKIDDAIVSTHRRLSIPASGIYPIMRWYGWRVAS